jgi:hypothetical protein
MTLKQATDRAAAALAAGDLEELARSLKARRQALISGEPPAADVVEAGDRLLAGLLALQQRAAFESARLGQVRRYVETRVK